MGRGLCSRSIATGVFLAAIVVSGGLQAQVNSAGAGSGYCWIDAATGQPVNTYPQGTTEGFNPNQRSRPGYSGPGGPAVPGRDFVRVPCPPTDASSTPPTQSSTLPGGVLLPGKNEGGRDTPDKPGNDIKTTDTKPTDSKTPATSVKDDKPKQADTPKTQKTDKSVTGKDEKPTKGTAEKTKLDADKSKTATAPKTAKSADAKSKGKKQEDNTQVHIEFFSTGGRTGSGGFGR